MKKCLSLIVVFALILTTLAMPMTASAYDISLMADNGDIAITFDVPEEAVKPGETFDVVVKATATGADVIATEAQVEIAYNTSAFTYKSAEDLAAKAEVNPFASYVQYLLVDGQVTVGAEEVTLATLKFQVNEEANPADYEFKLDPAGDTYFYFGNGSWYTVTAEAETVTVEENTAMAKVGEVELKNKTYYQSSLTIDIVGGEGATLKKDEETAVPYTSGTPIVESGSYVLTISVYGADDVVYSFVLKTESVDAVLNTEFTPVDNGYVKGATFEIPVTITGLGTATADMVSFDVVYGAGLTMVADGTDITQKGTSVVYGDGGTGALADGAVATLTFTVADEAAYGDVTITLANPQMSLTNDGIDPSANNIEVDDTIYTVTIVPSTAFGTIDAAQFDELEWSKTSNTVYVTADPAATVQYVKAEEGVTPPTATQTNLKDLYNSGVAAPVVVDDEATYYVVAKIGSVYQLVGTVNSEQAKVDQTAPIINASSLDMDAYASTLTDDYVITVTGIATDTHDVTYEASIDGADFAPVVEGKITIPAGTSVNGVEYIEIKAIDVAGNEATDTVKLYLDGDAPAIANIQAAADKDVNGQKPVTANVTDATSTVTAKWYMDQNAELDIAAVEALAGNDLVIGEEGLVTVPAAATGTYYIVATDAAQNKTMDKITVTFDEATVPGIKVAVVKEAATTAGVFKAGTNNGSFTYVKVELEDTADGYTTVMYLDEAQEAWSGEIDNAEANHGPHTVKVVTTHNSYAADTKTVEYSFTIVSETAMPSVNNDKRFNIIDYGIVSDVVAAGKALPDAEALLGEFTGGIYAGDVDGDFGYDKDDVAELIRSIRAGERPGSYTFKILNKFAVEPTEE